MTLTRGTEIQKDSSSLEMHAVLEKLREHGFRITRQRKMILEVILEGSCTSTKEIYATVRQKDPTIGFATVYRMVNLLEEIGIINRRNFYRIGEKPLPPAGNGSFFCTVTLSDNSTMQLTSREWSNVVRTGLKRLGFVTDQTVTGISISSSVIDDDMSGSA